MKGLLKNNFLAVYTNAKVFSVFLLLLSIFAAAVISPSLQIGYVMIGTVGFSVNAMAVVKNDSASKWGKYKLTLPVKRADIIRSLFENQLIWLLFGTVFCGLETGLSWLLHGCPFDQPIDLLSVFVFGISTSLLMGAIFFPLLYWGGEEKSEVFLVIAFLCAIAIDYAIISIINAFTEPGPAAILLGTAALLVCSLLAFAVSCPLTVCIFKKKEY